VFGLAGVSTSQYATPGANTTGVAIEFATTSPPRPLAETPNPICSMREPGSPLASRAIHTLKKSAEGLVNKILSTTTSAESSTNEPFEINCCASESGPPQLPQTVAPPFPIFPVMFETITVASANEYVTNAVNKNTGRIALGYHGLPPSRVVRSKFYCHRRRLVAALFR